MKTYLTDRQRELFRKGIFPEVPPVETTKPKRRAYNRAGRTRVLDADEKAALAVKMGWTVKPNDPPPS